MSIGRQHHVLGHPFYVHGHMIMKKSSNRRTEMDDQVRDIVNVQQFISQRRKLWASRRYTKSRYSCVGQCGRLLDVMECLVWKMISYTSKGLQFPMSVLVSWQTSMLILYNLLIVLITAYARLGSKLSIVSHCIRHTYTRL